MWTFFKNIFSFSNIKKGWKTTYLGVIIILCALVSVFTIETMTWTEASVAVVLGLGLLGVNDPTKKE